MNILTWVTWDTAHYIWSFPDLDYLIYFEFATRGSQSSPLWQNLPFWVQNYRTPNSDLGAAGGFPRSPKLNVLFSFLQKINNLFETA